ncbi:MAG TPA: hypothetical protein VGS28_04285 [Candidatus Saccharimonadales bacterium]|nr:hypothetical protein [Candidatus Saccharimonadales bacterium]
MLVQIIASRVSLDEDIEYFRQIKDVILSLNNEIPFDWLEAEYDRLKSGEEHTREISGINRESMEALSQAELIVVEGTSRSFSTGYQVAVAIQMKKPVLILTRGDASKGTFGAALSSELVTLASYGTKDDLKRLISEFVQENTFENKDMRFNFFIDRKIYNYLRWASYKTGKTKAAVLRDLVEREIDSKEQI